MPALPSGLEHKHNPLLVNVHPKSNHAPTPHDDALLDQLLQESDWIPAEVSYNACDVVVHKRILDRLRSVYDDVFKIISETRPPTQIPIPSGLQHTWQPGDEMPVTRHLTQICLAWVNYMTDYAFIDWKSEAMVDDNTFIPQLFMREDTTDEHKYSIMQVMTAGARSAQMRRELGMNDAYFEHCITSVLGTSSPWWKLVHCPEDAPPSNRSLFTVVVPVKGDSRLNGVEGRSLFCRASLPAARQLLLWHYHSQGWSLNRTLSIDDARIPLDDRLYLFSIRYNATELFVHATYPVLVQSEDNIRWAMRDEPFYIFRIDTNSPPSFYNSLAFFLILATLEQHMRVLANLLYS